MFDHALPNAANQSNDISSLRQSHSNKHTHTKAVHGHHLFISIGCKAEACALLCVSDLELMFAVDVMETGLPD